MTCENAPSPNAVNTISSPRADSQSQLRRSLLLPRRPREEQSQQFKYSSPTHNKHQQDYDRSAAYPRMLSSSHTDCPLWYWRLVHIPLLDHRLSAFLFFCFGESGVCSALRWSLSLRALPVSEVVDQRKETFSPSRGIEGFENPRKVTVDRDRNTAAPFGIGRCGSRVGGDTANICRRQISVDVSSTPKIRQTPNPISDLLPPRTAPTTNCARETTWKLLLQSVRYFDRVLHQRAT